MLKTKANVAMFASYCPDVLQDDISTMQTIDNKDLLKTGGKPDQPGDNLKVFRFEGSAAFVINDLERNLVAYVGINAYEICETGYVFDNIDIQEIWKLSKVGQLFV